MRKLLLFIISIFCINATAQTIHIVTNKSDLGEGTLRQIITDSQKGDTIRFSPLYFTENGDNDIIINSELKINKSLFIEGLTNKKGEPYITIRVPVTAKEDQLLATKSRIFNMETEGCVSISSLILKGGDISEAEGFINHGGVIFLKADMPGGNIYLRNLEISEGKALFGGGIYVFAETHDVKRNIVMENNKIHSNIAEMGGGINLNLDAVSFYKSSGVNLILKNNLIYNNKTISIANIGGGIYLNAHIYFYPKVDSIICGATVNMINNFIYENQSYRGGGIYICTYTRGSSDGYYSIQSGEINLTNNLFYKNSSILGGAIFTDANISYQPPRSIINITNNTVSLNKADYGGGIYLYIVGKETNKYIILKNSIVWGNKDNQQELSNISFDSRRNDAKIVSVINSCIEGDLPDEINTKGNISNDPKFVSMESENFRLLSNSPCINTGDNHNMQDTEKDIVGNKRIMSGTIDIGAYEYVGY